LVPSVPASLALDIQATSDRLEAQVVAKVAVDEKLRKAAADKAAAQ
jgi:hypothetical protein